MTSQELEYKALDDFLILPVQRIPRYIMLLDAIYKYTPASHPDREVVKKASQQMRTFAEKINRRKAAKAKLLEFCNALIGYPEASLYTESRYMIREGYLYDEKKRVRYCVLMNDLLLFCKAEASKGSKKDLSKKMRYKFIGQMRLDSFTQLQVHLAGTVGSHPSPMPYIISLKNSTSKYTLTTQSNEEGKGWSKDIHSVLDVYRKKTPK